VTLLEQFLQSIAEHFSENTVIEVRDDTIERMAPPRLLARHVDEISEPEW
jgi:hypothetical protein